MYKNQLLPAEMAEDSNEHDEKWHSFLSVCRSGTEQCAFAEVVHEADAFQ